MKMWAILGALLVLSPLATTPVMAEDPVLEERVRRLEEKLKQYQEHERREGPMEQREGAAPAIQYPVPYRSHYRY